VTSLERCGGLYDAMPGAPTAVPVEPPVAETFRVGGGGSAAAWVCGNGRDSTLPVGAAGPREIDPVTSPEAGALREAYGLENGESLKRDTSELQPANATATSVRTETRNPWRERGASSR
jgi:hypothetical protein